MKTIRVTAAVAILALPSLCFGNQKSEALEILGVSTNQTSMPKEDLEQLAREFSLQRDRDIEATVAEVLKAGGAAGRSTDPFGTLMGVPLKESAAGLSVEQMDQAEGEQAAKAAGEGFVMAIKGIDIRGVNPGRNEFLAGSDNVFEGDVVDISGSGGVFRLWIVEVGEDGVTVMDDKSRRTEKIPLSLGGPAISNTSWGASGSVKEAPPF